MSKHDPVADAFIDSIPAGSLWRLNSAGIEFYKTLDLPIETYEQVENFLAFSHSQNEKLLKISDSKSILHFSRGNWNEIYNVGDAEAILLSFSDDKNIAKIKIYDRVDVENKKEVIVHGGGYIAVFLMPNEYADNEFVIKDAKERVSQWQDLEEPFDCGSIKGASKYWSQIELLTRCRKPYDLAPVQIPEDGSDPEVSILVNITDGENNE